MGVKKNRSKTKRAIKAKRLAAKWMAEVQQEKEERRRRARKLLEEWGIAS